LHLHLPCRKRAEIIADGGRYSIGFRVYPSRDRRADGGAEPDPSRWEIFPRLTFRSEYSILDNEFGDVPETSIDAEPLFAISIPPG
jgi:hypothetical protein